MGIGQPGTRSLPFKSRAASLWVPTGILPRMTMAPSEYITERRKAELVLKNAGELQRRLIACSQDCIKVLDLEGRLLWMNESGMQGSGSATWARP